MKISKEPIPIVLGMLALITGLFAVSLGTIHWYQFPELTYMQIFKQFWFSYIVGVIALTLGAAMLTDKL